MLEGRDIGHVASESRLEQPIVARLVLHGCLGPGATQADHLHQAPAQLDVYRRLLSSEGSEFLDDLLQLREPGRGQRRDRRLWPRADGKRAPAVGIACQNQVAGRRRVARHMVLATQQGLAPTIGTSVAQDIVQATITRRTHVDVWLERQVDRVDRPAVSGVHVAWSVAESAAALHASPVMADRYPVSRIRALEIDKQRSF